MNSTESKVCRSGIAVIVAGAAALLLAASAAAQTIRFEAQPANCKLKMEGTSTIHNWTVESTNVNGFIEADANFPESALKDPAAAKPAIHVSIPVSTLKSYADAMDAVMQDHLNMEQYPLIEYRLIVALGRRAVAASDTTLLLQDAASLVAESLDAELSSVAELLPDGSDFNVRLSNAKGGTTAGISVGHRRNRITRRLRAGGTATRC